MEHTKRMLSLHEGMEYTGLKQTKFREWAAQIGALKKIGSRALYDKHVIDKALDRIGGTCNEEN